MRVIRVGTRFFFQNSIYHPFASPRTKALSWQHVWQPRRSAMTAPLVGKRVVVEGLASKPELNGSKGTATSFDDAKGRYNVKMDAGGIMALKPANVLPDRAAGGSSLPVSSRP